MPLALVASWKLPLAVFAAAAVAGGALWSLVAVAVLLLGFSHRVLSRTPARAAPARI